MTEDGSFVSRIPRFAFWAVAAALLAWSVSSAAVESAATPQANHMTWWMWVVILFTLSMAIGFGAVLAGVGGGVIFVPILVGFFPFHTDFVRAAGILVALATALAAGPKLMSGSLARLRVALPCALIASVFAVYGVELGFAIPVNVLQTLLGASILGATALMVFSKQCEYPEVSTLDAGARLFDLQGRFLEESTGIVHPWRMHRTIAGLASFALVGLMAGMFGLGSGWASVPILNLVMGLPLKMAIATSLAILLPNTSAAAWGYLNHGAILPILVAPCLAGVMIGSRVGATALPKVQAPTIRRIVIVILLLSGLRALLKGLGV
jgi:uncharacterized membrane protein YfcA